MAHLARQMLRHAESNIWGGQSINTPYFRGARREHFKSGTVLILTRESGYHSSGWWKNPDYERCYHLSLSFFDPETGDQTRPFDRPLALLWLITFFGDNRRLLWEEPSTGEINRIDVHHYRLFCNPAWEPIKPRGEVYTRQFTERGWLSFSDAQEKQIRRRDGS